MNGSGSVVNHITVDAYGNVLGQTNALVSTRYLFKLWSSQHQSLTEMIISTRLEAARRLLATNPRVSVAAVAHRCGFRNVSHFCRRYRAAYQQTPTETQLGTHLVEAAVAYSVRAEHQVRAR